MKNDLICPNCKKVLDFKNMFSYEEKEIEVLGIIYFIKCSCGNQFVSDCRLQKRISRSESFKLINEIKNKMEIK